MGLGERCARPLAPATRSLVPGYANLYRTGPRAPLGRGAAAATTGALGGAQGQAAMHRRSPPK